jgi:Fe2+-dicitrate sensor, membrane component
MNRRKKNIKDNCSASESNREDAGGIKQNEFKPDRIYYLLDNIRLGESIEREADRAEAGALTEIHRRIDLEKRRSGISFKILAVSASLAILITLSGLFLFNGKSDNGEQLLSTNTTSMGVQKEVNLPDGSKVVLNGNSILSYTEAFGKKKREVVLNGEAYFDVTHNEEIPFIVRTGDVQVKVLGTTFNVESYQEDEFVNVTLETGKVSMNISKLKDEIIMEPNQQVIYNKESHEIQTFTVNAEKITGWKEGRHYYDAMPLRDITRKLKRYYDVDFKFGNEDIGDIIYTIEFDKKESINDILNIFSMERRLNFSMENNLITITK